MFLLPVFIAVLIAATISFAGDPVPPYVRISLILTGAGMAVAIAGLITDLLRTMHVMWACIAVSAAWLVLFAITALEV
jgi:hypothetical protein